VYEIPKPELLDPDRVDRDDREDFTPEDHRSQARLLAKALGESCAYADQLWEQLNAVRGYLLASLPPDPRTPGPHRSTAASPTGPDDDAGWQNWIDAFAGTTSVLCGSHGDSGFGLSRAREEARLRRTAPELRTAAERSAHGEPEAPVPQTTSPQPAQQDGHPVAHTSAPSSGPAPLPAATLPMAVKTAAGTVVAVLAARGLRTLPRPGRRFPAS
jgi:hypothetical protein